MPVRLGIGDCVLVRTTPEADEIKNDTDNPLKQGIGLIKYIGYIHGQKYSMKQYVGIELIEPIKTGHDGNINGYQYFTAQKGCGIHVSLTSILCKLSVSEIVNKLKDILTFFKTKLSQYMVALSDRDDYIEKLKLKLKTNRNNTNNIFPKLKISNDSSNTSYSSYASIHHSSFKLKTANKVINKLLTETRTKRYHTSCSKQSHILTPITPMTPNTQSSFRSMNSNTNNTNTNTPTTNTTNMLKDNNSNSYPSTSTNTNGTSTYTNNTVNSHRAILPIINEPNHNNIHQSRKILSLQNNESLTSNNTYSSGDESESNKSLSYSNLLIDDDDTLKNNNIHISTSNTPNKIQYQPRKYVNYPYHDQTSYNNNNNINISFKTGAHVPVFGSSHSFNYQPNQTPNGNNDVMLHCAKSAEYIPQQPMQNIQHSIAYPSQIQHVQHVQHTHELFPDTSAYASLSEPVPNSNTPTHSTQTSMYTQNMYQPILRYFADSVNNNQNNNQNEKRVKFKKRKNKNVQQFQHSKYSQGGSGKVWTGSTYNNNINNDELDDELTKQGFIFSAQYMYGDN